MGILVCIADMYARVSSPGCFYSKRRIALEHIPAHILLLPLGCLPGLADLLLHLFCILSLQTIPPPFVAPSIDSLLICGVVNTGLVLSVWMAGSVCSNLEATQCHSGRLD